MLADGCFDPLHVGHISYLRSAASLRVVDVSRMAETFYVRIAPDSAIVAKGRACFQSKAERAQTVRAVTNCEIVYYDTLALAVRSLKPRLLVKGIEWNGRLPDDVLAACVEVGAHIVFTTTQARTSTERLTHD